MRYASTSASITGVSIIRLRTVGAMYDRLSRSSSTSAWPAGSENRIVSSLPVGANDPGRRLLFEPLAGVPLGDPGAVGQLGSA